jgi:hypothetical protein
LRYLTEYRVLVAVHPSAGILREARAAAEWAGATMVVVTTDAAGVPPGLPASALVVAAEEDGGDVDGIGARLGAYAAAVDRGDAPDAAVAALAGPAEPERPS